MTRMNTSRTRGVAVLAIIILWATFNLPDRNSSIPGDATQEELEAMGVVVVGPPSVNPPLAGVATLTEEDMNQIIPHLKANNIGWVGYYRRGCCGLYVDVKDYHRARKVLAKLKGRYGARIAVWEPKQ
jgi:hypothetical protein